MKVLANDVCDLCGLYVRLSVGCRGADSAFRKKHTVHKPKNNTDRKEWTLRALVPQTEVF